MMKMSLGELIPAIFIKRDNRFRAEIEVDGIRHKAHVPNSGGMSELLFEGAKAWVSYNDDPIRKTAYSLILIENEDKLVCVNSLLANNIFAFW